MDIKLYRQIINFKSNFWY